MVGIEKLQAMLAFAFSLHETYDLAIADGKIDFTDVPLLLTPGTLLVPAFQGLSGLPAEVKDLEDSERQELMAWAKSEYDIADDVLEAKVESGLSLALHVAQFIGDLTDKPAETPAGA